MKKKILLILLVVLVIVGIIASKFYSDIFLPNIKLDEDNTLIHIPSGANFDMLVDTLSSRKILKNHKSFKWVAGKMSFKNPKPGRYRINNNWSNKELITVLRAGRQEAKKITFNNVRTINELAEIFGTELEASNDDFINYFLNDATLSKYKQTKESMLSVFIPNTYEFYRNTSPTKL